MLDHSGIPAIPLSLPRRGALSPRFTAQGVEAVCEYCEARGLCRRNYWP